MSKAAFIRLSKATAGILLVRSGTDGPLIDVEQDEDRFAAENAEIIHSIYRKASK